MRDPFGRPITYLRISVTDRCNMKCVYCIPPGMEWLEKEGILSYEEIERLARLLARLGVRRVRLTGGEPTIRRDLPELVKRIAGVPGIEEVALSTNGLRLAPLAAPLRAAGLHRVNVSLDSFRPDRFREITRGGDLAQVLEGIEAAEAAGLNPVKLNAVILRGRNDDEVLDFARATRTRPWHVRFIEMMPLAGNVADQEARYVPTHEIRSILETEGALEPVEAAAKFPGNGPALTYRYAGAAGTVGFISPLDHNFCDRCNRVRLTADGRLRLCLFGDGEVDLAGPTRAGEGDEKLAERVLAGLSLKPKQHYLEPGGVASNLIALSQVGG
jgi:cyclic pyranopterin phosphate synthase